MRNAKQNDLTSKLKTVSAEDAVDSFIELAIFGSNKIIEQIGKDRSHISKAIEYLKKNELLEEHGKWEKGKVKNTRMTRLGLSLALMNSQLLKYKELYSEFQQKIKQHYDLPRNLSIDERENRLIELGWDRDDVDTYELSLNQIHGIEFGLISVLNNILVSEYITLLFTEDIKKDVRAMLEYKIIESIRTSLQNLTFTNLSLEPVAEDIVINQLLSTMIAPSFHTIDPIIDYLKFDFDDLPNDGNRKFVKDDIKQLLRILIHMMTRKRIPVPLTIDLEKYKPFLDEFEFMKKTQLQLSNKFVGSQIFQYNRIEKSKQGDLMSMQTLDGREYDATDKFVEIFLGSKSKPQIAPRKVARIAFFRTKLIISIPSELKLRVNSNAFISSYEELKKLFYGALEMIDYTNEYDEYDVDMPVFSIVTDNSNLVKRIRIDGLVDDLHKVFLARLIGQLIILPLERTDEEFANYLKTLKTKEKDFTFILSRMI